jgi:hypothetical protein
MELGAGPSVTLVHARAFIESALDLEPIKAKPCHGPGHTRGRAGTMGWGRDYFLKTFKNFPRMCS